MQKIRPDMDIGKNIQSLRYKNNLTQEQVIAKLNLIKCTLCQGHYDFFLFRFLLYICLLCRGIKVMPLINCFHLLL